MSRQKTDRIPRQNILYDLNFENNTLPSEKDINFKSKIPFDLFYFILLFFCIFSFEANCKLWLLSYDI